MKNLDGIFPPIVSPFDSDGELLVDRFAANLEHWGQYGLAGVTVLGSNGESAYLSDDEKLRLVRDARLRVPENRTLIVGAGRESTRLCSAFLKKVADLGADYALIGTPCYFKARMTDDALFAHFWAVADDSPIPILVYNVPQFTGVSTSLRLIQRLAAHENIAGIKESSANLALQADIRRTTHSGFRVLVGSAPTLLPSLIQGACGGIVAVACALPALTVELWERFRDGDWKTAASIQERLSPPAAAVTTTFGIPGLKAAMTMMGLYGGEPRLPLLPLDPAQRAALQAIFQAAGLFGTARGGQ
jgi:4-hydroxy-2-oxoglutarate aldolase